MIQKPIVGITLGDIAGIGPEIVIKSLLDEEIISACNPLIIGDIEVFKETLKNLSITFPLNYCQNYEEAKFEKEKINIIGISSFSPNDYTKGKINLLTGKASLEYIKKGIQLSLEKKIDLLVTAPVNKESIIKSGFIFSGHTEYLANLSHVKKFAMMLVSENLKVVLATTHLPLKKVSTTLSSLKIYDTIMLTYDSLKQYFGLSNPTIGVSGLNPHCGEGGSIGNEEITQIIPAILKAQKKNINVQGPFPADTLFVKEKLSKFDAIITMYHDQGMIPIKMNGFGKAVNITLGLPFIRTSPDHGTGFDIAGKNIANPESLKQAIKLGIKIKKESKC
ncbi:MAG: 4-hydroxythreonine-4-phosphate dehydrogenase PdxA [bacterium]